MKNLLLILMCIIINTLGYSQNLKYSTFIGGNKEDIPDNAIMDRSGNIYISGTTTSTNFPVKAGAYDVTYNGGMGEFPIGTGIEDMFILKFDMNTNIIVYCTYLGGSRGPDFAWSMEVDSTGSVYLGGNSGASDYPVTGNVYDSQYNGSDDRHSEGILTKINPDGTALVFSTFFPAVGDFALDKDGYIYIVGEVKKAWEFTSNALDTSFNGKSDLYIAKLNPDASKLEYATFFGGNGEDRINESIILDDSLNIYFSGSTTSTDLPVTNGSVYAGTGDRLGDAYVGKFNFRKNKLEFLTYFGGTKDDEITNLVIKGDTLYALGRTNSADFPVTSASYDDTYNGGSFDFFLTSFSANSGQLYASTYLGGSNYENQRNLTMDRDGNLLISGNTNSTDFPTTSDAYNTSYNGGSSATFWMGDAILVKMKPTLDEVIYSTYIGGSSDENSVNVLQGVTGNIILVGATKSSNFPVTNDALDKTINGDRDIFIMNYDTNFTSNVKVIKSQEFKVFPNPARDKIFILNNSKNMPHIEYTIADLQGKNFLKGVVSDNYIDITKLSVGVFILQLNYDKRIESKILVKQ